MNDTLKIIITIMAFLAWIGVTILAFFTLQSNDKATSNTSIYTQCPETQDTTFTETKFIEYLKSINIKHPDIVYAQALLESGNFTSPLFKEYNNIFGMTSIGDRPTTSLGNKHGFAYFKSWQDSVLDYVIYQCLYLKDKTREEYLQYIDSVYSEDPEYKNKIEELSKQYGKT